MTPAPELARPTALLFALLLAGGADAQPSLPSIGLSTVGSRFLENETFPPYEPELGDHFGAALAVGDFNDDGADDLAAGVPEDDDVGGDCGIVVVRWGVPGNGLATGLATTVLHQGLAGSPDPPESSDYFGFSLAAGDFNGDGFDDLAVGVPGENSPSMNGGVQIYYGGSQGLDTGSPEYIDETLAGGGDNVVWGARFGWTLAAGNFDHDAFDDLAIGAWRAFEWSESAHPRGGAVYVAHGKADGLLPWYGYRISQDEIEMQDVAEEGDQFGFALVAGDFGPDSYDDLAIGVPGENDYGMIQILFGSQFGLLFATNIIWLPGALGEDPEPGDRLGGSLASGDFDGDLYDDLAIGNPHEDLCEGNARVDVGRVSIAFGSNSGFDLARTKRIDPDPTCEQADNDPNSYFGWALAAGDFDGDGKSDLAIGQPNRDVEGPETGQVRILMGEFGSGVGTRARWLLPGVAGVPGDFSEYQHFGGALAAGDFDGDGWSDLAIGVPFQDQGSVLDAGGVAVLYGALFADGFEGEEPGGAWSEIVPEPEF